MTDPKKPDYQAMLFAEGDGGVRTIVGSRSFDGFDDDESVKHEAVAWAQTKTLQGIYRTTVLELVKDATGIHSATFENKFAHRT